MKHETLPDNQADDHDLDALMMRVREAARLETAASPAVGQAGEQITVDSLDVGAVLTAQAAWNERTTKSLAVIAECLQNLHDAAHQAEAEAHRRRPQSALARSTVRTGRIKAGRRRRVGSRSKNKKAGQRT
jgi:hypothetical protein